MNRGQQRCARGKQERAAEKRKQNDSGLVWFAREIVHVLLRAGGLNPSFRLARL